MPLESLRNNRILVRAFWFGIAGVVTIALNPALFWLFHQVLHWNNYAAYALSLALVNVLQFLWNYFVGFSSSESLITSAKRQAIILAAANSINYILVVTLQTQFPAWKLQVIVFVQIVVAGAKFIAYHHWVYPDRHERQQHQ